MNDNGQGPTLAWSTATAAAVLAALYWYMTGNGLHTTSDSIYYISAANSWRETGQLLDPDGSPYRYWGPLYPLLLSVRLSTGATRVLHGAALVSNLLLWSWIGGKLLPQRRALVLPWALALSTALMVPAAFVWSETVFAVLLAGYCGALIAWGKSGKSGWLALATGAAFLLPLQRTAGMVLLAGVGLGLVICRSKPRQWGLLLVHWVLSAAGGVAWNYYAERVAGTRPDHGFGTLAKLWGSLADYGFVLLRWFLPLPAVGRTLWAGMIAVALPVGLTVLWVGTARNTRSTPENRPALRLLWLMAVVYVLGLLLAVNMTRGATGLYDAERYVAVLSGPVLLLALAAWPLVERRGLRWVQRGIVAAWLLYLAVRVGHNVLALRLPVSKDVFSKER